MSEEMKLPESLEDALMEYAIENIDWPKTDDEIAAAIAAAAPRAETGEGR